jgi:hypothetical protein
MMDPLVCVCLIAFGALIIARSQPPMNFLVNVGLPLVALLLVMFVLRALIGVRQEYRMRERRLHMQRAIDDVEV